MALLDKVEQAQARFLDLEKRLADPDLISDMTEYRKLAKEYADITPLVSAFRSYQEILSQVGEMKTLLQEKHDSEFESMAKSELKDLESRLKELLDQLNSLINPPQKDDDRDIIIEIRAGTGGEEASLFSGDLYRMYSKYADSKGWKIELMEIAESEKGGLKEVIFSVSGKGAAKRLKWESGAHRVQRVPATEASGRIHTSAATVAVMFEPEEIDIKIDPKDLKIDVYRSSGPGGQCVNTTDSAVRMTHIPTGTIVTCQDERSQLKNRAKAMRVMRARLMDRKVQEEFEKASKDRKSKIGSGDRSEKIRTYNFQDRRVTDHRIGFTSHRLDQMLNGALDELTDALLKAEEETKYNE